MKICKTREIGLLCCLPLKYQQNQPLPLLRSLNSSLCDLYCTIDAPVIKLQYTRYAIKLHLSARAPLTNVEAVAANVNWKKNFDWRYFGILIPRLDSHYLFEINSFEHCLRSKILHRNHYHVRPM